MAAEARVGYGETAMLDAKDYPRRILGRRVLAPSDAVDRQVVTVNLTESPLGWLMRRGLISERQFAAGERLRGDHWRGGHSSRVTMRWERGAGHAPADGGRAEAGMAGSVDARARFDAALAAVGRGLGDILWRVVCEGEGLEAAEKGLGWPVRSGKLVLGLALDRLADFYETGMAENSVDKRNDIG
jgi:hypothetical protein